MQASPRPRADAIGAFLTRVELGPARQIDALTLWPLLQTTGSATRSAAPEYELLADALARWTVTIDEVSDAGSVPNARVRNHGDVAVLVLFGEELRGAKQNRVANASFLVPPRADVVIDVSCVEAGRWSGVRGQGFHATASLVSHKLRAKLARSVGAGHAFRPGRFPSDQAEVWSEVAARLDRSGVRSPTVAYADYHAASAAKLERIREAAGAALPGQVGFVAAIGGRISGIEVLCDPRAFAASVGRLLDAHAIDALEPEETADAAATDDPARFLRELAAAHRKTSPSLGLGEDVRIDAPNAIGCALVAGSLVHLTAAPRPA